LYRIIFPYDIYALRQRRYDKICDNNVIYYTAVNRRIINNTTRSCSRLIELEKYIILCITCYYSVVNRSGVGKNPQHTYTQTSCKMCTRSYDLRSVKQRFSRGDGVQRFFRRLRLCLDFCAQIHNIKSSSVRTCVFYLPSYVKRVYIRRRRGR